jgi:hypothetical protein
MSSAKEGKLDLQPLAEDDLHVALHPTAKVQTCGLRETGPKSRKSISTTLAQQIPIQYFN